MATQTNKIILSHFGAKVEQAVKDKARLRRFVLYMERYFDKNNEIIYAKGPTSPLLFANRDMEEVLNFLEIDEEEVRKVVRTVPTIKATWRSLNNPFVIMSVYLIRELTKQKLERERELAIMYLSFKIYSSCFRKYFKHGVVGDIMDYTMNSLSDKFKYKHLANNYALIKDVALTCTQTYTKEILQGNDDMLNIYVPQMDSRINKILQKVANVYYENYKNKRYLHATSKNPDIEDQDDFETSESLINGLAEGATNYFLANRVDLGLARSASGVYGIPFNALQQAILDIRLNAKVTDIRTMFVSMLMCLYEVQPEMISRVCSTEFTVAMVKQISISNSTSTHLATLKSLLDKFLNENCSKFASTNRPATKMAYRSALYRYMVFILIINKCR